MKKHFKEQVKGALLVPVGLAIVLAPFSLLVGWNLLTAILFWFVITPALSLYLPKTVSKSKNHFFESLLGLMIFYGLMVFMIYEHYKSDLFRVMIFSCLVNLILISVITWTQRLITPYKETCS